MDASRRQITKIAREAGRLTIRVMRQEGIGSGEFDLIHLVRHRPGLLPPGGAGPARGLCRADGLYGGVSHHRPGGPG